MAERNTTVRTWVRRVKKFLKWTGLVLLGASLAAYVYVRMDILSHANRLEEEIDEARKLGVPLSFAEIDRRAKTPETENAAIGYVATSKSLIATPWMTYPGPFAYPNLLAHDAEVRSRVRPIYAELGPILSAYRSASQKTKCAFAMKWDGFEEQALGELQHLKTAARWLAGESVLAAADGKWDRAIENLVAIGRIGGHVGEEPLFINALIQVSIQSMGFALAEKLAWMARENQPALRRLRQAVAEFPEVNRLDFYSKGEAFGGYWIARNLSRFWERWLDENQLGPDAGYGPEPHTNQVFPPLLERSLMQRAYAAQTLKYWNEVIQLSQDQMQKREHIRAKYDEMGSRIDNESKPWMRFVATFFPFFDMMYDSLGNSIAKKRTHVALFDVLLWEKQNDMIPLNLTKVSIDAVDPFDKKPLKYKITKTGFRVYSVGSDRVDGNGRATYDVSAPGTQRVDDVVASFPYREHNSIELLTRDRKEFDEAIKKLEELSKMEKQPIGASK